MQVCSLFLKKCENLSSQLCFSSFASDSLQEILVPPLLHLAISLLSLQQIFMPSLKRLEDLVNPLMTKWASPRTPSTLKQNQEETLLELVSFSSSTSQAFCAIISTLFIFPHQKLLLKVTGPMGIILPILHSTFLIFLFMLLKSKPSDSFLSSRLGISPRRCFS